MQDLKDILVPKIESDEGTDLCSIPSIMMPDRNLYLCPGHANSWLIGLKWLMPEIPIDKFEGYGKFVVSIKYTNNNLITIPDKLFTECRSMIKLDLQNCCIEKIPESIGECKNLMYFDIESNNVEDLPNSMADLPLLRRVCLDDNIMMKLPPVITRLHTITRLIMNNLMLTSLPDNFGNIANLEQLYMNGNCLTSLPKSFGRLKKLKELSIAGVPWMKNKPGTVMSKAHFMEFFSSQHRRWIETQVKVTLFGRL